MRSSRCRQCPCRSTTCVDFIAMNGQDLLEHNQSNRKSIIIREDAIEEGGGTCVLGMREVQPLKADSSFSDSVSQEIVHDFNGVSQWVQLGCSARTVGKTKMNEASSRSHAIFTVTMEQQRVIGMCVAPFVCASLTSANTGQTAVRKLPLSL